METIQRNNTGIFFFLAAARGDQREFVVPIANGKPATPVHTFAERKSRAGFRAKETLFALSEPVISGTTFHTRLLHIETNDQGKPTPIDAPDVAYRLFIRKEEDTYSLHYRITPESAEMLKQRGFHDKYPAKFSRSTQGLDQALLAQRMIDPLLISTMPIPPHHRTPLATIARRLFNPARPPARARLDINEWEVPAALAPLDGTIPTAPADNKPKLLIVQELPKPPKR